MKSCICGNNSKLRSKIYNTRWSQLNLLTCRKCNLTRDASEYNDNTYYMPEARIYEVPDEITFQNKIINAERYIRQYLTYYITENQSRVLEIGSNDGAFLMALKNLGLSATGIEINPELARFAIQKDLQIINKPLTNVMFDPDYFDFVLIIHTLEHIPGLSGLLNNIFRILKPGGYLFVAVPNFGIDLGYIIISKIMKRPWHMFIPGQHIWYFTKNTLISTCAYFGFKKVYCKTRVTLTHGSKILFGSLIKKSLIQLMKLCDCGGEIVGLFQKPANS